MNGERQGDGASTDAARRGTRPGRTLAPILQIAPEVGDVHVFGALIVLQRPSGKVVLFVGILHGVNGYNGHSCGIRESDYERRRRREWLSG